MKTTHNIEHVEAMILERLDILQNGETKEQKRKARSEVIKLEKHLNGVNDKLNGKVYPERMKGFPDDVPMDKEAVLRLIDSVDVPEVQSNIFGQLATKLLSQGPNLEGVSVGKNTFEYVDLGWPKAKEPKQGKLL